MPYSKLIEKKKLLDSFGPLPKELLINLNDWFRVELTYSSNAIEGNTLTRSETALVVEKGLSVGGKTVREHLEARNHAAALDWLKTQTKRKAQTISENDVLHLHNMILKGIDDLNAGNYRSIAVRISGSRVVLPNPAKVSVLISEFFDWIKTTKNMHPVELAAEAHYRLVTIHPFVDGNGRTARLLMNMILLMSDYPPAIIQKRERLSYINALEKAQLGGSKDEYQKIIIRAVSRSLDIYLKAMQDETVDQENQDELLKIGQLAKEVGESNSTIRYWTKEGLLEVAEVSASGYHFYSNHMIDRVKKIQDLKRERYTLGEIKQKLAK